MCPSESIFGFEGLSSSHSLPLAPKLTADGMLCSCLDAPGQSESCTINAIFMNLTLTPPPLFVFSFQSKSCTACFFFVYLPLAFNFIYLYHIDIPLSGYLFVFIVCFCFLLLRFQHLHIFIWPLVCIPVVLFFYILTRKKWRVH